MKKIDKLTATAKINGQVYHFTHDLKGRELLCNETAKSCYQTRRDFHSFIKVIGGTINPPLQPGETIDIKTGKIKSPWGI